MNSLSNTRTSKVRRLILLPVFFAAIAASGVNLFAQQPQLTLADLVIGLRSKKVSLEERNRILAEAVRERGVTFTVSAEIEKELTATGASPVLIDAVKARSIPVPAATPVAVPAATPAPTPEPTPTPTPVPLDFAYYSSKADKNLKKGDFSQAVADYDQAVRLKADEPIAFLNRGRAHFSLNDLKSAGADFDRSIQLDPKDSTAYFNRAMVNEKLGDLEKAAADLQKAVDLDAANEDAKSNLKRVRDELKALAAAKQPETPRPAEPVKVPEFIDLGTLAAANALKMVKPLYPVMAQKAKIEGRVTVDIELDVEGNVVSAKASAGHQFLRGAAEDAARKSKFKPAMFGSQAVKAIGSITYNFDLAR